MKAIILKEALVAQSSDCPRVGLEGRRKKVRVGFVPADIRTGKLPDDKS
jgi:hypothetical protein